MLASASPNLYLLLVVIISVLLLVVEKEARQFGAVEVRAKQRNRRS